MNRNNTFKNLFGETTWSQFIAKYWQKNTLYINRKNTSYFKHLINREDVTTIIEANGGKKDFVISVMGSKIDAPNLNLSRKPKSYWKQEKVYKAFSNGATIRLGNMANHSVNIAKLQQHIEVNLQTDVSINLYLTPPNSHAFGAHYDDHDVFIVQVEGSKTWKLFSPSCDSPVEVLYRGRDNWLQKELPEKTKMKLMPAVEKEWEIKLSAGDILYVPRGHVHQVYSENEESLHLTVAVTVVTWYEVVVNSLMETLKNSNILREALPPNFVESDLKSPYFLERIKNVKSALNKHLTNDIMSSSLDDMVKQFIISRKPVNSTNLLSLESNITITSEIQIREDIVYKLEEQLTEITLYFSGAYLIFPIRTQSMIEYILTRKKFIVKDLPTEMSDSSRIIVTKRLLIEGFVELLN